MSASPEQNIFYNNKRNSFFRNPSPMPYRYNVVALSLQPYMHSYVNDDFKGKLTVSQ